MEQQNGRMRNFGIQSSRTPDYGTMNYRFTKKQSENEGSND